MLFSVHSLRQHRHEGFGIMTMHDFFVMRIDIGQHVLSYRFRSC
jgi:hypothetical protein